MKIVVIGGGLVGPGAPCKLRRALPAAKITLLEQEPGFGHHQRTHNSGGLHAGRCYRPGSLKAPSPAATASLTIGGEIVRRVAGPVRQSSFQPGITSYLPT
jgi:L-2-hydroxyglutarate oxidase LhgO